MKTVTINWFFFSVLYIEVPQPCGGYNREEPEVSVLILNKMVLNMAHDLIRDAFRKMDTIIVYKQRYQQAHQFFTAELVYNARSRASKMMTIFMRSYDNADKLSIETHVKNLDDLTGFAIEADHITEIMERYEEYLKKIPVPGGRRDAKFRNQLAKEMEENMLRDNQKRAQAKREGIKANIADILGDFPDDNIGFATMKP